MPDLSSFLSKYKVLVDGMLRDGLFFEARNVIIRERYFELIREGMTGLKAVEKLADIYRLSEVHIKRIVYEK